MGSSNVSEDGASERVRFDNIVYYSMDEAIEKVCEYMNKKEIHKPIILFGLAELFDN